MIGKTFFHFVKVMFGLDEPQTQTTQAERELLSRYLLGAKRIVEIGVFEGYTTRVLAEHADHDAIIYGIDPFFSGRLGISWGEKIARSWNGRHLASGKLRLVAKLSTDVDDDVPTPVDFVFIDGDHSLTGIAADWNYWRSRVKPGGIVALHDTLLTPEKPDGYTLGSIEYFRDYIRHDAEFEMVKQLDSTSIMKRRQADVTLLLAD